MSKYTFVYTDRNYQVCSPDLEYSTIKEAKESLEKYQEKYPKRFANKYHRIVKVSNVENVMEDIDEELDDDLQNSNLIMYRNHQIEKDYTYKALGWQNEKT